MVYLLIIIVVALAGITRITLQQRREYRLHVQNDFRTSLEKVATQPLAEPADDGPRRRWELAGWNDRRRAREERVVEKEKPRKKQSVRRERPTRRSRAEREAPKRNERRRPVSRSSRRGRPGPVHRPRAEISSYEQVDWFEDLRSQPSDINLDHDLAPTNLPVNSRRAGQPSSRGPLDSRVHAKIHPAHMPPPSADVELDLRPTGAYGRSDAQAGWDEFAGATVAGGYRKRALSRRRAG